MLDDLGLLPALTWYFKRFSTQTAVRVEFAHKNLDRRFAPEVETAAYRIVQEAVTNVARHAEVSQVSVQVDVNEDVLHLRIRDKGQGFEVESTLIETASCGLAGMSERAYLLGGVFKVSSGKGEGCEITAKIPLAPAPALIT